MSEPVGRGRVAGTGSAKGLLPSLSGPFAASVAIHAAVLTAAGFLAVGTAGPERAVVIEAAAPEFVVVAEEPAPPAPPPEEFLPRPAEELPEASASVAELSDPFEWPPAVAPGTEAAPVLAFATPLLSHRFAPPRQAPRGGNGEGNGAGGGAATTPGASGAGGAQSAPGSVAPVAPAASAASGSAGGVSRGARFRETPARPDYPSIARRRGWEGRVVLRLEIGADGAVGDVSVAQSSGRTALDEAAVEGAFRWRFEPALEDGRPVASSIEKTVEFRLVD